MKHKHKICPNCFDKSKGKFCRNCGQKMEVNRLEILNIVAEYWKLITNIELSFFATLFGMFQNPGQVMSGYLIGQRKKYQNPITYFAIGLLFYSILGKVAIRNNHYIGSILNYDEIGIYFILVVSTFVGYLFSGIPQKFYYAEVLAILAYVYGTVFLVINPILLVIEWPFVEFVNDTNWRYFTILWDLPVIAYVVYAFRDFYIVQCMPIKRLTITVLMEIIVYLIFVLSISSR